MSQQQFEFQQTDRQDPVGQAEAREQIEERNRTSDYVAAAPLGGQKIYPPAPRRRRRGLWVIVGLLVVIFIFGTSGYVSNSAISKSASLPEQTVSVSGMPTVIINDTTGKVQVHSGSSSSIVVDATAHGGFLSNLSDDQVNVEEKPGSDVVIISVSEDGSIFNHGNVDLNITLPQSSNVQAHVNAGSLDINGVSGKMDIQMDAGALNFENGTLADGSILRNDAGEINFRGLLASGGNYTFRNNAGAINLYLQQDPSFTLDASAKLGHVKNTFGTDNVGAGPYNTHIDAHTDAGDITIQQS